MKLPKLIKKKHFQLEKSEEDLNMEHAAWKEKEEQKKKLVFERDKSQLDADYAALPKVFQKRLDRLRQNNPNFRWNMESYVMFVSKEAVKIINACKSVDDVIVFGKLTYEQQHKLANLDDGHSGVTFSEAMQLAIVYKKNEVLIPFVHSLLAKIVGCESVGCLPPTDAEKKQLGL